jgi:hypothetical protein
MSISEAPSKLEMGGAITASRGRRSEITSQASKMEPPIQRDLRELAFTRVVVSAFGLRFAGSGSVQAGPTLWRVPVQQCDSAVKNDVWIRKNRTADCLSE